MCNSKRIHNTVDNIFNNITIHLMKAFSWTESSKALVDGCDMEPILTQKDDVWLRHLVVQAYAALWCSLDASLDFAWKLILNSAFLVKSLTSFSMLCLNASALNKSTKPSNLSLKTYDLQLKIGRKKIYPNWWQRVLVSRKNSGNTLPGFTNPLAAMDHLGALNAPLEGIKAKLNSPRFMQQCNEVMGFTIWFLAQSMMIGEHPHMTINIYRHLLILIS